MIKDLKLYLKNSVSSTAKDYNHTKSDYSKGKNYAYFEALKVVEKLSIQGVTQQSEPLVAFMKYYKNNVPIGTQKSSVEIVKDYLATNGG